MVETLKASNVGPKGLMAKSSVSSLENSYKKVQQIAAQEAYVKKVESLLDIAQSIGDQNLSYRHPYVCDTFVKKIFHEMGNDSLKTVYGSQGMYLAYNNALKGSITVTDKFSSSGKKPQVGDLLFFLDKNETCPHVGIVSEYTPNGITIYDASMVGVGKRTIAPAEFTGAYGYTHMAYASPFTQ